MNADKLEKSFLSLSALIVIGRLKIISGLARALSARRNSLKKRSLHQVDEHFEMNCNAAINVRSWPDVIFYQTFIPLNLALIFDSVNRLPNKNPPIKQISPTLIMRIICSRSLLGFLSMAATWFSSASIFSFC